MEAVIIESTGTFSIYKRSKYPKDVEPQVLLDVPGYQKLVEHFEKENNEGQGSHQEGESGKGTRSHEEESANEIAAEEA